MAFPGGAQIAVIRHGPNVPLPVMQLDFLNNTSLNSRITFSRGTNATLVDSTGKITYAPANLLVRSEEFDNASWVKTNTTATANSTIAPDSATTADTIVNNTTSGRHTIDNTVAGATAGTTYTMSMYVKKGTQRYCIFGDAGDSLWRLITFDFDTQTITGATNVTSSSATAAGNGWFRLIVTATRAVAGNYQIFVGFSNASTNTLPPTYVGSTSDNFFIWGAQLELVTYQTTPGPYVATTASAYYGPRFDYDPVTLAPRGLLIEEARTNLLTYSEQFDNAAWVKLNATINANATTSPDGTVNADKLAEDATASVGHLISQGPTLTAVAHTYSVYAKASERNWICLLNNSVANVLAFFNLTTGTIGTVGSGATATITNAGNGWYRCSITFTAIAAANNCHIRLAPSDNVLSYNGVAGSGAFIYGAQLEAGAFATSYIPTVASTVSRSADVATMTGTNFSSWYNQSEGTMVVSCDAFSPASAPIIYAISDGTANNRIQSNADAGFHLFVSSGGVTQASIDAGTFVANAIQKLGAVYKLNDFAAVIDGGTVGTDASGTVPTVDRLNIGSGATGGSPLNGHIRSLAYYNTRLPNTQLQTLTAPSLASPLALDFISPTYTVGY
jgi:hypothetical protein